MAVSASAAYAAGFRTQQGPPPTAAVSNTSSFTSNAAAGTASSSNNEGTSKSAPGPPNGTQAYTTTALSRWSLLNHKLPTPDSIRSIHVYDFDNTLFKTPLPNSKLWNASTMGYLSNWDVFATGGWWHDVRILGATGRGLEVEEPRAWEGWWNEQIVKLVRLTEKQPGALCVLLTGRSEQGFGDLIQRMVNAKGLHFDMITLKPAAGLNNERFSSTMKFKQAFLEALMETYRLADEIRIYEDRPRHVEGFRAFLVEYNERRKGRPPTGPEDTPPAPITGEVVQVAEVATTLDPVIEVAEVQHMVNCHNAADARGKGGERKWLGRLALRKTVFFTGYLLKDADTKKLLDLLQATLPPHVAKRDLKYHGNSIMICPRTAPAHILSKVGGLGSKMTWRVEALGHLDNSVWAARVQPVSPSATVHTAEPNPLVVLAVYRSARPHEASRIRKWHPVAADQAFEFETTVAEKAVLRVEAESAGQADNSAAHHHDESESQASNKPPAVKRKRVSGGPPHHHAGPSNHHGGRPRPNPSGAIPTQPAAFVPRQSGGSNSFGPQGGGGRGHHHFASSGGRGGRGGMGGGGGFRGQGYATVRGGGHRGGGGAPVRGSRGGGPAGKPPGRPQPHHYYQSLDDAGGSGGAPIVYDETL